MRIAIPCRTERVSPVFDVARHLVLIDIENSREIARERRIIDDSDVISRVRHVSDLGVELLICGAISQPLAAMLASYGIQVVPFVSGDAEEVLSAYLAGSVANREFPARFRMPGCRGPGRRFRGRRGRGC